MKKFFNHFLPISALQAAGLSIFISFQFLSAGIRSVDKAAIILAAIFIAALAGLTAVYRIPVIKKKAENLPGGAFVYILLASFAAALLFSMVSPIPRAKDPSRWQAIEIQPLPDSEGGPGKIILVEIKLDGRPVPLAEWSRAPGWTLTPAGLENDAGSDVSLLIQSRGTLEQGATLLFEIPPRGGDAVVRLGWNEQRADFHRSGAETQFEMGFPAPPPLPWAVLSFSGLVLSAWCVILLAIFLFLTAADLEALAARAERLSRSSAFWVPAGFLVCYTAFFFHPVFLNASNFMRLENNLPAIHPVGNDLHLIMDAAGSLADGGSPYAGANKYPPLATAIFTGLLGLNIRDALRVLSTASLFLFIFLSVGVPYWLSRDRRLPAFAWFILAAGLFSYGFHFEIERGQFNLLAVGLALLGVTLYHRAPRLKWAAFILFCAAVQLKIYPAIFVLFFTRDWRDWKSNLLRWGGLGLANLALLAGLGWQVFREFFSMMTSVVGGLGFKDWPVSHSINGFLSFWGAQTPWVTENARLLQALLYLTVIALTALCLWAALRRGETLDPDLLLACTLAALTLPSLSNDYTLAFLIGPAVLFFIRAEERLSGGERRAPGWMRWLMAACALAFASTFFSYYVKPPLLQNQFPALLVMLACAAVFSCSDRYHEKLENRGTH